MRMLFSLMSDRALHYLVVLLSTTRSFSLDCLWWHQVRVAKLLCRYDDLRKPTASRREGHLVFRSEGGSMLLAARAHTRDTLQDAAVCACVLFGTVTFAGPLLKSSWRRLGALSFCISRLTGGLLTFCSRGYTHNARDYPHSSRSEFCRQRLLKMFKNAASKQDSL